MDTLVVPVFRSEASIPDLLAALEGMNDALGGELEVVLVVDGSPDRSLEILRERLPKCAFRSRLLALSRNFGAFAAVRAGLAAGTGPFFGVMAADLQEPPELMLECFRVLHTEPVEVVVGTRAKRDDPLLARLPSQLFWAVYRRLIQGEVPPGGVDVFACVQAVRDQLLRLEEANSSLVGLLFWVGFRRKLVSYERRRRQHGKSAWTLRKRLKYLMDSVFAFSDLPIRALIALGMFGVIFAVAFGCLAATFRLLGLIPVPGYAATILVITFFGALNLFALGIIGGYVWRAYENGKSRPASIVMMRYDFPPDARP